MPKDNTTFLDKTRLRSRALQYLCETPVILETHGGWGDVYLRCYRQVEQGCVIESASAKAASLARQRPTWAVYEADCVRAISDGAGAHLPVNFLDCDPYGECWPVLRAFFASRRPRPDRLVVAVNDGLRQKIRLGGAWDCESLQDQVSKYGNSYIHDNYLGVCRELVGDYAAPVGYTVSLWTAYYAGHLKEMTHFAAVLDRSGL